MYCVKVEKVWEHQKYETIAWLVIGVVHDLNTLCGEDGACYLLSMRWFSLEEERVMQQSSVSISLGFLRRHNCLVSMLEVLLFLCQYENFVLNLLDLNIHATIKKITLIIMLGSIAHQKFCFYHLPTRGRAGIKLGDPWYVSNVSIIFDCSMLLYYPFWMFNGLYIHFLLFLGLTY